VKVWVVTRNRFEHHEVTGALMSRHDEVERLDGDLPPADVARHLERSYARLYQPRWDESTSTIDDEARPGLDGSIEVGHEPRFVARLVDED